jgi:hypothetical protein
MSRQSRTGDPVTLSQTVRGAVLAAGCIFAGAATGLVGTTFAIETGLVPGITLNAFPYQSAGASLDHRAAPPDRARALAATHDCWTGSEDMPADMRGQYPGHVVATRATSHRPTYSAALVGPALDQVFGTHPDSHLTVHAFCR